MKLECVVGVMAVLLAAALAAKKCPTCRPDACPPLNAGNCLSGTTKDECDCCDVCAKLEGQLCDNRSVPWGVVGVGCMVYG